jgi:hypothetical protein
MKLLKENKNKIFVEYIHLGAIKAIVTLRMDNEGDINKAKIKEGRTHFLRNLIASISSFSYATLSFRELVILDAYINNELLKDSIIKNYKRQGIA